MKRNIYKLLSAAKQGLFALALIVFSATAYAQTTYTFLYTGNVQTLAVAPGNYSIECWGGNGGTSAGGKGGYSRGTLSVTAAATLYIYVGGVGMTQNTTGSGNALGGWNGGGNGSCYSSYGNSGGGGGGTDVRTTQNTIYSNRIIVAGGGGGGGFYNATSTIHNGGHGGGSSGTAGVGYSNGTYWPGQPGTQTSGGPGTTESNSTVGAGAFGLGGNHSTTAAGSGWVGCGGGGGWYGGSAGGAVHSSGGGGSGYIGGVTNGTTIAFGQTGFVNNPVTNGNGLVKISELCSINLTSAGSSNSLAPVICSGTTLTLTTNAVSNYSWSTGVTGTNQIVLTPTSSTVISVSGTSSMSCNTSSSMSITVSSGLPVLSMSATPSNSICLGDSVSVVGAGALSYTYNGVTPGVKFKPTQNVTFTLTGANGCGTSSIVATITVTPLSIFASASNSVVCASNVTTLTAVGAQSYSWYPVFSTLNPFIAAPSSNTTYTVIGKTGGCFGTTTVQVNTIPNPMLSVAGTATSICEGQTATLTVSGAATYTWQNSTLTGNTANVVTVSPNSPIAYNVLGTASNGCKGSAQYILLGRPSPTITGAATPTQICVGASAVLQVQGADVFTWIGGPSGNSMTVSPITTTDYVAVGTETTNGCSGSLTITVAVFQATISVSQNTAVCPGSTITLAAGPATSYTWGHGGNAQNTSVSPAVTTVYTINATGPLNGMTCLRTNTVEVAVHPAAVVTATAHRTTMCKNETTTLTASGGGTYLWSNGSTQTVVVIKPFSAGTLTYTVTGTDQNGCKDSHTLSISVGNCVGISENTVRHAISVYPNPNSGSFAINSPAGVEVNLVNELGQLIRTFSPDQTKTGSIQVSELSKGIYFLNVSGEPGYSTKLIVE